MPPKIVEPKITDLLASLSPAMKQQLCSVSQNGTLPGGACRAALMRRDLVHVANPKRGKLTLKGKQVRALLLLELKRMLDDEEP